MPPPVRSGIEALAEGLCANVALFELRLANQRANFTQAGEEQRGFISLRMAPALQQPGYLFHIEQP